MPGDMRQPHQGEQSIGFPFHLRRHRIVQPDAAEKTGDRDFPRRQFRHHIVWPRRLYQPNITAGFQQIRLAEHTSQNPNLAAGRP